MLTDSIVEPCGYDEIVDFTMSEKFGIDWKKMDTRRASAFVTIIRSKQEREERDNRKNHGKR